MKNGPKKHFYVKLKFVVRNSCFLMLCGCVLSMFCRFKSGKDKTSGEEIITEKCLESRCERECNLMLYELLCES
jgi:hypothetical protein